MIGKKKKIIGIIIAVFIMFIGYRVFLAVSNGSGENNSSEGEGIPVTTTIAKVRDVEKKISMTGDTYPNVGVEIVSKVTGQIEHINVGIGDKISKGDIIAIIEHRSAQLKVKEAEASLKVALADLEKAKGTLEREKAEYESAKILYEKGMISGEEYRKEKGQYLSAVATVKFAEAQAKDERKAKLDITKKDLEDYWIRSPIDGIVTRQNVDIGTMVYSSGGGNSKTLFTVEDLKKIKVLVEVPARYASELKVGQRAEVIVPSLNNKHFVGKVTRVSPAFDQNTRSSVAIVKVDNSDMQLMSGLFVKVLIYTEKIKNAVMISRDAVFKKDRKDYAFVMNGGKAQLRELETGVDDGDMIQVLKGVSKGEAVIVSNKSRIYDGAKIKEGLT